MTIDTLPDADIRIASKNAIRKEAVCPCCGNRSALLRLAALWRAAYVMRDPALEDAAHDLEREIGMVRFWT